MLELGELSLAGADSREFHLSDDQCTGQQLAPEESCTFTVAFQPQETGTRQAGVSIPSNAGSSPDLLPLDGMGVDDADRVFSDRFQVH